MPPQCAPTQALPTQPKRERVSKGFHVTLPSSATPCGWYEAIAHLIPTMPDSQLLPKQHVPKVTRCAT